MIELPSPCLVVLVGPAGSGKSSWAAQHLREHVVSSDMLRAMVGEGENDLRASIDAFVVLDDIVDRRLRRGLTVVIDSLGSDAERRAAWRELAARHRVPCVAIVFDVPPAQIRRQNRARAKRVPDVVMRRQLLEWPTVLAEVRAEPFAGVHVADVADVATLVPPALIRRPPPAVSVESAAKIDKKAEEEAEEEAEEKAEETVVGNARGLSFGLQIPQFGWPGGPPQLGDRLRAIARAADGVGLDSLWLMDHFRQIPQLGPAWGDMLESWTTIGHLAACTTRVRLGTLVTGITYRNVAHLAKIVATVDVLSRGRVTCGLGLAWFEDEHRAYGWTLPSRAERYALLEDALQLLPKMWGPGAKPFEGRVLSIPDTSCYPRPLQSKVPILVGGSGESRTLKLVACYADACNLFGDPDTVQRKVEVLHRHCADAGRDPAEISITHLSTVLVGRDANEVRTLVERTRPAKLAAERYARAVNAGTIDQHLARLERFTEAGVDHAIVSLADLDDHVSVERYGELIAAWRDSRGRVGS